MKKHLETVPMKDCLLEGDRETERRRERGGEGGREEERTILRGGRETHTAYSLRETETEDRGVTETQCLLEMYSLLCSHCQDIETEPPHPRKGNGVGTELIEEYSSN